MKFEDKLVNLRKSKKVSQEELAEKLNVTRQTISKWELGQSKPDMDKLIELSKYYGISVEELTNSEKEISIEEKTVGRTQERKQRKGLLYFLLIILISAIIGLAFNTNAQKQKEKAEQKNTGIFSIFGDFFGDEAISSVIQNQQEAFDDFFEEDKEETKTSVNRPSANFFNGSLVYAEGTKSKFFLEPILDNICTSNKTNKDQLISVVFGEKETSDVTEIKNIKRELKENPVEYEVTVEYDDAGYIYKIIIEEI